MPTHTHGSQLEPVGMLPYHVNLLRLPYKNNSNPMMAMALQHCYYQSSSSTTFTNPSLLKPFKTPPLPFSKLARKPHQTPSLKELCKQGNLQQAFDSFTTQNPPPGEAVYSSILELCASKAALAQGQQIHAHIITSNLTPDSVFLRTKLVFMYGKCGSLSDAQKLFDEMPHRTVFTWNGMIGAYVSNGEPMGALELYREMRVSDVPLDACTFPCVLKACGALKDVDYGTEIHGLAIKCGFVSNVFVVNSLVAMYSKCDDFNRARQLFDRMVDKSDVVSWNSIISTYVGNGKSVEALRIFREMHKAGIVMNSYTVVAALQACEEPSFLKLGIEIHAALLKSSRELEVYETNALVVMYSRCGKMDSAVQVFESMKGKDNVSWNSMLSGFLQNQLYASALGFFLKMHDIGRKIDLVSLISIVSASGRLGNLLNGMEVHAYAIKHGFDTDLQVGNTLIDMYAKCCCINYMDRVFDKMINKDFISWTTAIAGHAQSGSYLKSLELFREVQISGMKVDAMMIGSILLACSGLRCFSHVRQIHSHVMRQGLLDLVLENTILDAYGECGTFEYASRMFDTMDSKDVVSCTSMMTCYVRNGFANEALHLFSNMVEAGIEPDMVALMSVLSSCASLSALKKGKEIHGFLIRNGFTLERSISSSLIDMYAHCGVVDNSHRLFNQVEHKDLVSWTSMINACGMHGQGREAIDLFRRMINTGITPDHITFLALLYACSHSGLIEEGKDYLQSMRNDYLLEPWAEHYACVVDLLGRANCLDDAYDFVKGMPIMPTPAIWCALLGACRVHCNDELAEIAATELLELEPEAPGNYVLVSNMFASRGKWKNVDQVRMRMKERGLRKNPACTWIEIGNQVHTFIARDRAHPQSEEIYSKLTEITEKLKRGGYVADTKFVLHDSHKEEKIKMLHGHSERLAIAFGLIGTSQSVPIRITKNLRVCGDCHVFTKLVSKLYGRVIVVRDANRFHHFEDGVCSCGDFW